MNKTKQNKITKPQEIYKKYIRIETNHALLYFFIRRTYICIIKELDYRAMYINASFFFLLTKKRLLHSITFNFSALYF